MINVYHKKLFILLIATLYIGFAAGEDFTKVTVFNAGDNNVNSFRIPSLVTSKNGTLIAACEARRTSWRDKSPTDIAVKRSTDGGKTWSSIRFVTDQAKDKYAFMDPCLLADNITGNIFLFACRWPQSPQDGTANVPFVMISEDDGRTWSAPQSVLESLTLAEGGFIDGFGPGSGIQLKGEKYKNRLVVPIRLVDKTLSRNRAVYSDDHGKTWTIGDRAPRVGEFQIAELAQGHLYYNCRIRGGRAVSYSLDGGQSWGNDIIDQNLPGIENGCQGSVLGVKNLLLYTGIEGGVATNTYDDRKMLKLFISENIGQKWQHEKVLYEKAAGYSCTTLLPDGSLAIIFEAGDNNGFIKTANRPPGWMRLDVIILPPSYLQTISNVTQTEVNKNFYLSQDKTKVIFNSYSDEMYHIFTSTGCFIKGGKIAENKVDISNIPLGVYLLQIGKQSYKFIK